MGTSDDMIAVFFFFNDTATTEIYTLSLHDALPIWQRERAARRDRRRRARGGQRRRRRARPRDGRSRRRYDDRSEEHTSELQSRPHLVCRLLLGKKKVCLQSASGFVDLLHAAQRTVI